MLASVVLLFLRGTKLAKSGLERPGETETKGERGRDRDRDVDRGRDSEAETERERESGEFTSTRRERETDDRQDAFCRRVAQVCRRRWER